MKKEKEDKEYWIWIIGSSFALVIIGFWFFTYFNLKEVDFVDRGTFGDMFGSINALYSGLAFAGIIFTILLQRKELKYQREELRETREEFKTQNRTLKLQRFENTFFNLLSLHHQIVDSIDLDIEKERKVKGPAVQGLKFALLKPTEYDRIIIKGRDVFKEKYDELIEYFEQKENLNDINNRYLVFYESVQTDFGHYFRNLYRIIKLVDETEFHSYLELDIDFNNDNHKLVYAKANFKSRYKYTSIIRSQLSDYELLWLFYNCLSVNGNEKFKPYIEKYSLLKNIPLTKLHNLTISSNYNRKAYKI